MHSTGDYEKNNCVTCCTKCNLFKNSIDALVFINRSEHILTYQKIINGNLYFDIFGDHTRSDFCVYKNRASKKDIEFSLSKDEFETITKQCCYVCGKKNSDSHLNGIDRFDNTGGYFYDNCRPCCTECNSMKLGLTFENLVDHLKNIYNWCYINGEIKGSIKAALNLNDFKPQITKSFSGNNKIKLTEEALLKKRMNRKDEHIKTSKQRYSPEGVEEEILNIQSGAMKTKINLK